MECRWIKFEYPSRTCGKYKHFWLLLFCQRTCILLSPRPSQKKLDKHRDTWEEVQNVEPYSENTEKLHGTLFPITVGDETLYFCVSIETKMSAVRSYICALQQYITSAFLVFTFRSGLNGAMERDVSTRLISIRATWLSQHSDWTVGTYTGKSEGNT
jgi:hypothetical protein